MIHEYCNSCFVIRWTATYDGRITSVRNHSFKGSSWKTWHSPRKQLHNLCWCLVVFHLTRTTMAWKPMWYSIHEVIPYLWRMNLVMMSVDWCATYPYSDDKSHSAKHDNDRNKLYYYTQCILGNTQNGQMYEISGEVRIPQNIQPTFSYSEM